MNLVNGIFAQSLSIQKNYFGAETSSTISYSGGGPNTSEYMSDAIQLNTPSTTGWVNATGGSIIANRIDRSFRGIGINSMEDFPLAVEGNSIYLDDDATFTSSPQFGVSVINNNGNLSVSGNTLEAQNSNLNTNVSLMYFNNNYGTASPHIHCNFLKNSYYGFQFDGLNPNTVWEGNQMCTNWAGMALTNGGIIGQQGTFAAPSNNYWAPVGLGCVIWGVGAAQYQTYCDPISDPSWSPIFGTALSSGFPVIGNVPTINGGVNLSYLLGTSIFTTNVNNPYNYDCWIYNVYPGLPSWRTASQIAGTKINENKATLGAISIYPNPTDAFFSILSVGENDFLEVKVIDVTGKTLYFHKSVNSSQEQIDVSKLPSGVYIVEIKNQTNNVLRKKLIKQ
jgi:hypothetical protein